jgi:TetR/AcrR family transcriptional repressor of nem operon
MTAIIELMMTLIIKAVKPNSARNTVARISTEEKARNRQKIVKAASRLFRTQGVENVGVAELMKEAGMTHGGFYNHIESKTALVAETCESAFRESREFFVATIERDRDHPPLAAVRTEYLSTRHRDQPDGGCPSSSLILDAWRGDDEVQAAYATGLAGHLAMFTEQLVADADARGQQLDRETAREQSIRQLSSMVGSMLLARAVRGPQPALSDEILQANRCPTADESPPPSVV